MVGRVRSLTEGGSGAECFQGRHHLWPQEVKLEDKGHAPMEPAEAFPAIGIWLLGTGQVLEQRHLLRVVESVVLGVRGSDHLQGL